MQSLTASFPRHTPPWTISQRCWQGYKDTGSSPFQQQINFIASVLGIWQNLLHSPRLQAASMAVVLEWSPQVNLSQCCFNRKLFYAGQIQAMCDHQCQFLDIFVGSVHFKIAPCMFTACTKLWTYRPSAGVAFFTTSVMVASDDVKNELQRDPKLGEWLHERMAAALSTPHKPLPALEGPDCH